MCGRMELDQLRTLLSEELARTQEFLKTQADLGTEVASRASHFVSLSASRSHAATVCIKSLMLPDLTNKHWLLEERPKAENYTTSRRKT